MTRENTYSEPTWNNLHSNESNNEREEKEDRSGTHNLTPRNQELNWKKVSGIGGCHALQYYNVALDICF